MPTATQQACFVMEQVAPFSELEDEVTRVCRQLSVVLQMKGSSHVTRPPSHSPTSANSTVVDFWWGGIILVGIVVGFPFTQALMTKQDILFTDYLPATSHNMSVDTLPLSNLERHGSHMSTRRLPRPSLSATCVPVCWGAPGTLGVCNRPGLGECGKVCYLKLLTH